MKKETLINDSYVPMATIQIPTIVGGYRWGGELGFQINFTYKPNWFHRTMVRLCFGLEWIDDKI